MYATNIAGQRVVRLQRGATCQAWPRGSADEQEPTLAKLARGPWPSGRGRNWPRSWLAWLTTRRYDPTRA
eukprot:4773182-Lingulodinium_polyedra.AAC.1